MSKNDDYTPLEVTDIQEGYFFEYDLRHWKVTAESVYEWNNGTKSREFKITEGGQILYLEIEEEDELRLGVSKKTHLGTITENVTGAIERDGFPPDRITFKGTPYTKVGEYPGRYKEKGSGEGWEKFVVWDYIDESGKHFVSIEEWDVADFEVYTGQFIQPEEISNIGRGESSESSPNLRYVGWLVIIILLLAQFMICSKKNQTSSNTYYNNEGLSLVIKQYADQSDFTILLEDMDYQSSEYKHKYKTLLFHKADSSFSETTTLWMNVSPRFFSDHKDHLGMELAHKADGKLSIVTRPPGFSNYIGNEKYGKWVNDDQHQRGDRRWEFFAKYLIISRTLNYLTRPTYYSSWHHFDRTYRHRGGNYYGTGNAYKTPYYVNTPAGRNTQWGKKAEKDRGGIIRSANNAYRKNSRSGSRYSNSSSRSRSSGSFGK